MKVYGIFIHVVASISLLKFGLRKKYQGDNVKKRNINRKETIKNIEDIPKILAKISEESDNEFDDEFPEYDHDLSEEEIISSDHCSQSEQEIGDGDDESSDNRDSNFYIGKNNVSCWKKSSLKESKTKKKNIVKILPGPKSHARNISSELNAFFKFFDMNMIDNIIKYTNMYISGSSINYVRARDCKSTTREELTTFLGAMFLIGTYKGGRVNIIELWNSDGTGMEMLRALMSYKRFLFLCMLRRLSNETGTMSEYVTIDEMLHPFHGRCSRIQYIPSKPAKYGIKVFAMCDAKT
ncbi:piggyBac transposable element-derived protein 4-like [Euwallacea similis]|uniref:piggyBac transposable element-derived protein 4-like n=1 Tax=Euwallacea similis TaxID=1736056 RepID=UPI00344E589D